MSTITLFENLSWFYQLVIRCGRAVFYITLIKLLADKENPPLITV